MPENCVTKWTTAKNLTESESKYKNITIDGLFNLQYWGKFLKVAKKVMRITLLFGYGWLFLEWY